MPCSLGISATRRWSEEKYRLTELVGPSLLVELEPGLFMPPLGLSKCGGGDHLQGMFEPETVHAFAAWSGERNCQPDRDQR